ILKQLKGLNPNVKVIVSSGYSNDPVIEGFQQFGFDGYIAKPYRIYELSRTLDLVLNSELPNPLI
ncbi:MAG: response regulator transcription factor, partial [Nitrospirae bacterium]|nr:response regulator transcription factor [Nitrospirota bacterium]